MKQKVKQIITEPWLFIIICSVIFFSLVFIYSSTFAGTSNTNTSATVSNVVPAFTAAIPSDNGSDGTTPTNVGADTTFSATATDANGDQWHILVCNADDVSGTSCGTTTFCTGNTVNSGAESHCHRTALQGDAESVVWYAFACDATGCSANSQGSASPSPFKVNHPSGFSVFGSNSPQDPGVTITFTSTSSDADTDTANDTVSLYVCKANDFTGSACGAGGTWCSATAQASNPTCNASGVPIQDDNYSTYAFVIDSHGLASTGISQGTGAPITISNVAPVVSTVALLDTDGSGNLTLNTENNWTTGFKTTFTVTDANGCLNSSSGNEIASAATTIYRSDIGLATCTGGETSDYNNCYIPTDVTWAPSCEQDATGNTCSGASDTSVGWTCTFGIESYADSTNDTYSKYHAENWLAAAMATDDDAVDSDPTETASGNDLECFAASNATTSSIAYGSLNPGGDSADKTITIQSTGNVGLDENIYAVDDMSDGNSHTIAAGQQKASLAEITDWTTGTLWTHTKTNPTYRQTNIDKSTSSTPANVTVHWMLRVPNPQASGAYTATTVFGAHIGDNPDTEW